MNTLHKIFRDVLRYTLYYISRVPLASLPSLAVSFLLSACLGHGSVQVPAEPLAAGVSQSSDVDGASGAPSALVSSDNVPSSEVIFNRVKKEQVLGDRQHRIRPFLQVKLDLLSVSGVDYAEKFNRILENYAIEIVANLSGISAAIPSLDQAVQSLADGYAEDRKSLASDNTPDWTLEIIVIPLAYNDRLISLGFTSYAYLGGAHGNDRLDYRVITTPGLKVLTLRDLVKDEKRFNKVAEEIFRSEQSIAPDARMSEAGFTFYDDNFHLNDNFALTESGVLFVFNPYEIASFSKGAISLLVPYDKVENLLKFQIGDAPIKAPR